MDTQSDNRAVEWSTQSTDEGERVQYAYEIPATMPFPEYGESVPVSFVQMVD